MEAGTDDETLMLRYRDGDAAAFEILYGRHRGGLYRFILRSCRDAAVSEELFQDVWMNLIHARVRYEARAKFRTWLFQMARNRVIDHLRRCKPVIETSDEALAAVAAPASGQPDQRAESAQATQRLLQLVHALPEEQREAFVLHEEAGLGIQEIAEITGVNPETAKSRLRYALRKLRAGLGPYQ